MFISEQGLNLIKAFEGCILQSYDDYNDKIVNSGDSVRGTLTIGYGHIEGVYIGQIISLCEAEEMLKRDMIKYCNQVDEVINDTNIPFNITQGVYDAFVSFDYNLGQGCLRTLLANGTRDKQTVADMMLEYRNKGSQWEEGLFRRRKAERELFLTDGVVNNASTQVSGEVAELQGLCNAIIGTNLVVDNIWGNNTDNAVRNLPLCGLPYVQRELTTWVQLRLGINADGIFGEQTYNAVIEWQRAHGLSVDGVVGYNTYKSLALV